MSNKTKFPLFNRFQINNLFMSQIMQIVKEKSLNNRSAEKLGDAKNAPIAISEIKAADMIGLSWIVFDYSSLKLLNQGDNIL